MITSHKANQDKNYEVQLSINSLLNDKIEKKKTQFKKQKQ
jgi:hypothetical protein